MTIHVGGMIGYTEMSAFTSLINSAWVATGLEYSRLLGVRKSSCSSSRSPLGMLRYASVVMYPSVDDVSYSPSCSKMTELASGLNCVSVAVCFPTKAIQNGEKERGEKKGGGLPRLSPYAMAGGKFCSIWAAASGLARTKG